MKNSELKEYLNMFPDDADIVVILANPKERKKYEHVYTFAITDQPMPILCIEVGRESNLDAEEVAALERMRPKKPKLQVRGVYDDDNGDWICDSEWHMCPTCTIRNEVYPTWEYCRYCGQRLDWGE